MLESKLSTGTSREQSDFIKINLHFLYFGCPSAWLALQHGGFCTMWPLAAKGPLTLGFSEWINYAQFLEAFIPTAVQMRSIRDQDGSFYELVTSTDSKKMTIFSTGIFQWIESQNYLKECLIVWKNCVICKWLWIRSSFVRQLMRICCRICPFEGQGYLFQLNPWAKVYFFRVVFELKKQ